MSYPARFLLGGILAVIGLAGLAVAASEREGAAHYGGLAAFGCAVVGVMALIRLGWRGTDPRRLRDTGPMPLHMAGGHGSRPSPAHLPAATPMPAQGLGLRSRRSPVWIAAVPWLRGAACIVVALLALVVASTTGGAGSMIALAVAALSILVVFRLIACRGWPPRLIPIVTPESPPAAFALGGLFAVVALIALATAAVTRGVEAQTLALIVAVGAVLAIFVLIRQGWDLAEQRRRSRTGGSATA